MKRFPKLPVSSELIDVMNLFRLTNPDAVESPALLVDALRVQNNLDQMIAMVGGDMQRLRPHVKTHKMPDVVAMQVNSGISQFKTATLSEAAMVASAGGKDVLIAHQLVGPKVARLHKLTQQHSDVSFACVVDDPAVVQQLANAFANSHESLRLYIDIDCGMHRTGISLDATCDELIQQIRSLDTVQFAGLHVYDGHLHQPSVDERRNAVHSIAAEVRSFIQRYPTAEVVVGGSPTFATWAEQGDWQCSPGTTLFWDVGYAGDYPELEFQIAAAVLTRVISRPAADLICLDLGHKAVSAEMPLPQRVVLPEISDAVLVAQSEEHLVVRTTRAEQISVGDAFLAFPKHICPTVAKHATAHIVRNSIVTNEIWPVTARDR